MKKMMIARGAILAAALAALGPAPAAAQDNVTTADPAYDTRERDDDDDFPWGLLGLLGLAGLAGLKRRERDIHVDARRNP